LSRNPHNMPDGNYAEFNSAGALGEKEIKEQCLR
jgi:hypothetical protein